MDNDGGSIRSLPSVAPQPLTSRSSARVGVAPEFSELRKTSHLQLTPHEEEEAKLRPDMEDTHARRLISQTAPRILNSKVCGGAQLKLAPQPPPPQGLCDQRLCCCLTFCTVWVLVVSVALFTLWYYYLQNTNYSLREAITALDAKLQEGLQVMLLLL